MEALGRVGDLEHGDVRRQVGVDGPMQHVERQLALGAEADHLPQGVDAGVGPPAGQHADSRR